jgi:hypothetical protein
MAAMDGATPNLTSARVIAIWRMRSNENWRREPLPSASTSGPRILMVRLSSHRSRILGEIAVARMTSRAVHGGIAGSLMGGSLRIAVSGFGWGNKKAARAAAFDTGFEYSTAQNG